MGCEMPVGSRARRGRDNHRNGVLAEDCVARQYGARGARILGRRVRGPGGEIDLVAMEGDILVFVEVKRRRHNLPLDQIVTPRQWLRLEAAASHYMLSNHDMTGAIRGCRFDLAVVGPDAVPRIIENARSFDTH